MVEKKVRGIPLIGKQGLLALLGAVFGIVFSKAIWDKYGVVGQGMKIAEGFYVNELVEMIIPLVLLFVFKRFKAFFIGWFIGVVVAEVYEYMYGLGGYTAPAL